MRSGDDYEDRGGRGERGKGRGRGGRGGGRGGGSAGGGDFEQEVGEDGEVKKPPVTYVPPEPTQDETEIFSSTISTGINFDKFDCIAVKVRYYDINFINFFIVYTYKTYAFNLKLVQNRR